MAHSVGTYTVNIEQTVEKGKIWDVRVYRKGLFKRCVSSDWFLDERQANDFARSLEERLRSDSTLDSLKKRKPGWVLV